MASDLRAIAERVVEEMEDCPDWNRIPFTRDAAKLARAYLAEHPADSELPLTTEWLRSVGFESHHFHRDADPDIPHQAIDYDYFDLTYGGGQIEGPLVIRVNIDAGECELYAPPPWQEVRPGEHDGIGLTDKKWRTRGDVRRLCAALGIPLKE